MIGMNFWAKDVLTPIVGVHLMVAEFMFRYSSRYKWFTQIRLTVLFNCETIVVSKKSFKKTFYYHNLF